MTDMVNLKVKDRNGRISQLQVAELLEIDGRSLVEMLNESSGFEITEAIADLKDRVANLERLTIAGQDAQV